ncbi:antibiotic biosynthesis monooxygenase [Cryptosporangium phraense]|uniref:Antibiotic biosynthesis monooxygenase n=1 Tax=Cryptosporangium phraense TaxID=2593070 RepID=A0A545AZ23_9ACTN|nr:antibiotic biosynthesis monooxygenase [Cryptosporangium phraense]
MIIVAGWLRVDASDRDRYLDGVASVTALARDFAGCADFVQAPDPLDPGRIVIMERWESDEDLLRFRNSGGPELDLPEVRDASVQKYRISSVEAP